MSESREEAVVRSFVSLAGSLVDGVDPTDLLTDLTDQCVELLDVASAGLLLADARGVLHVMAASSPETRSVEIFQQQRDEGPCRDCYHLGEPVVAPDLRATTDRWPQFSPMALEAGFASVHALPLRLRRRPLGALGLFGAEPGRLGEDDLQLGQALADVASIALVHDRSLAERPDATGLMQRALVGRVVIEQAKGFLAQKLGLGLDEAFVALRAYARAHDIPLSEVAAGVTTRALLPEAIVAARPPSSER